MDLIKDYVCRQNEDMIHGIKLTSDEYSASLDINSSQKHSRKQSKTQKWSKPEGAYGKIEIE